jgi:integrase
LNMARKPEVGNVQLYPNRALKRSDKNGYVLKFYCPIQGRRIRKSCGTRDRRDAGRILRECRGRLLNGRYIESGGAITADDETANRPKQALVAANGLTWAECSEQYRNRMKSRMRPRSHRDTTYRLSTAERILRGHYKAQGGPPEPLLADCTTRASLEFLQDALLDGSESRRGSRSPNSVNSMMASIMAFVGYCRDHEWIDRVPRIDKIAVDEVMKGRPISGEEFERMIAATPVVVGKAAADSWTFTLKVLWESTFRIQDAMRFSWDDTEQIHPIWPRLRSQHPTLAIPSSQKNRKIEEIPMLPSLAELLRSVPKHDRTGWIVNPQPIEYTMKRQGQWFTPAIVDLAELLPTYSNCSIAKACGVSEQTVRTWLHRHRLTRLVRPAKLGQAIPVELIGELRRKATQSGTHRRHIRDRLTTEHVGKIIGEIGEHAGIVVRRTKVGDKTRTKYASAHDLRRGCAQRLINAGISAETLKVIMRHREFSTTERYYGATRCAQSAAAEVAQKLAAGCSKSELVGGLVGGIDESLKLTPAQLKKLKALLQMI